MRKTSFACFVFLCLILIGCKQTTIKEKTHPFDHKWQPISLKDGEFFQYLATATGKKPILTSLFIKQDEKNKLQAQWNIGRDEEVIVSKQVIASAENILISSKAALMTEKNTGALLNTVLMHWWPSIDYFKWEIGFKRAVLVDMLAGFMVQVIDHCEVAKIKGYRVELKSGVHLMAEACLAPSVALPLSVTRYDTTSGLVNFQAALLSYQKRN